MGERLRTTAAQHPGRALGLLAAVAVLGTALASGWTERLALSSGPQQDALQIKVTGSLPRDAPAYRVAVRTMRIQLSADPAIASVSERRGPKGTNSTLLLVAFGVEGRRRDASISRMMRNLDPGPLTISFRGPATVIRGVKDDVLDELVWLLLALPVVALIAIAVLGMRPAGAALLAAAASSAAASLVCELLAGAFDVYWLALVGAVAAGALLSLQLAAMASAGATATAIWVAALAAAATFAATVALGVGYLASLGLGGALGSLLAAPAALTAIGATAGADDGRDRGGSGRWGTVAEQISWNRPIAALFLLLALALMLVLAVPADRLATVAVGVGPAPTIDTARVVSAICLSIAVTALLSLLVARRIGLAIATALVAALPGFAATALLVLGLQDGAWDEALDYSSSGAVQLGSAVSAFTVVAALCAAQAVTVAWAGGRRGTDAVTADRIGEMAARIGPPATLACLAGIAAGLALGASSLDLVQEFGLGTAAGLALELLVVQGVLAPALLRLTHEKAARQ